MKSHRLVVVAVLAAAWAIPSPAQRPASRPSDLGSPPETVAAFSTDYRALVAAALPRVTAAQLGRRLSQVRAEAAAEKPLAVRDVRAWAALFGLRVEPRRLEGAAQLIDLDEASYLVDPEVGHFYVSIRHPDVAPVARPEFAQLVPEIRRAHDALARRIGIPRREIFFVDFRETLAQSTPQPRLTEAREGPIEAVGATTTLLRAVGGLLVDGSFVRISSVDARRFEMVDVRWPPLRLAPEVEAKNLVAPARLADRVVARISATAQGKAANVLMAVVLRPVDANHRTYFVPSLRVGVLPKSEPEKAGYRTDAGEEFYFDLIAGMEELADRDDRDLVPESLERKLEQRRPEQP